MEELNMLAKVKTPADVLVTYFDKGSLKSIWRLLLVCEMLDSKSNFPEPTKKLGQQLKYADARGFAYAVIAGEDELAATHSKSKI